MSFAYLPLYTGDYLRDTRACSMAEHGAYLLLLIHCWDTRDPVPLDEREAAGICNARSGDELEAMRRVLRRYFVRCDDGWYNRRMQMEIERSTAISNARSEAGKRGYQAKAKQLPSKSQASASNPIPTSTPSPISKLGSVVGGEVQEGRADPKKPTRFAPPALLEVKQFVQEHRYPVDPVKFWNHYESNGWRVGKNPMKNWQAAVRTWSRKEIA